MSLRNCLFCGKLSKKTYPTVRGHLWKDTQRTLKEKDTSEKTSSFSGLSNKLTDWLILGNLSDKSETVSKLFFLLLCKLFVWIEHELIGTYFDFMLVVHRFIKRNELKLIPKFIILWNFCFLYVTQCLLSELISSWTRLEEKFHICSLIHYFASDTVILIYLFSVKKF